MSIAAINVIASRQAGAFSVAQCESVGVTEGQRRHMVRRGQAIRLHRGVLAVAGSADTPDRRLWAGRLALGGAAIVSHRSGLWVWDMAANRRLEIVEFSIPGSHFGRRPGITAHRVSDLRREHVSIRRGLPVTTVLRTLVDCGAVLSLDALEDAFDRGVAKYLYTPPAALAEIERHSRHGRPGIGALRAVLLDQGLGSNRNPSYLEAKALRLFRQAGLPEPVVELKWGEHGQFRLDFIWVEYGVVVEVDGWDCHSSPSARRYDLGRRNRLVLDGLVHLTYIYGDIVRRGDNTVREILDAFALAGKK